MPAYMIADIDVTDAAKYEGYKALSPGAVAAYGGKFVSRGSAVGVLEGNWRPGRIVIVEFPSLDAAKSFYNSPEYAKARAARAGATGHFNSIVVEGL
jgi:uncharacterized protein (DUF1330 family)